MNRAFLFGKNIFSCKMKMFCFLSFNVMNTTIENKSKALIFVLACVLCWSFIPVVARFGQQDLDNYQFLFWSSLLSFLVLFSATCLSGRLKILISYGKKDMAAALALGFLGSFLYYLLLYFGYAHLPGLEVLVIQYTWPIFIIVFSALLLKEKITLRNIVAIALGFLGVMIVLTKGNFAQLALSSLGVDLVILLAASLYALFSVLSKKVNLEPFSASTYFFLSATIFSFLSMMFFSQWSLPSEESLIPILSNGIFINGLSYVFWLKALQKAKASFLAPFIFLVPIIGSLLIVAIFHETFLPIYGLGLVLVVLAGLISR